MKLIDLLVHELPKRGGWPEGAAFSVQSFIDNEIYFYVKNMSEEPHFRFFPCRKIRCEDEVYYKVTREQYEAALAASKAFLWDGEGQPPEGIECEVKSGKDSWTLCKVAHSSSAGVAFIYLEEPTGESSSRYIGVLDCIPRKHADGFFRPIRTEAERKRDDRIVSLNNFIDSFLKSTNGDHSHLGEALYEWIAVLDRAK